jgi:hypothetical protein
MINLRERRVHIGKTARAGEIDRIHDGERLGSGALAWKSGTRDFADGPDAGQMQSILTQKQTIFIEECFAAG